MLDLLLITFGFCLTLLQRLEYSPLLHLELLRMRERAEHHPRVNRKMAVASFYQALKVRRFVIVSLYYL